MLNITFNQIRLFATVARHKSFTKAAKELSISQPAVSSQLKKLAESIGDPLIEVVGRKVYLTPIGETTYQQFQILLEDFEDFNTRLRTAQTDNLEGDLVIAGVSASKYFLPFIIAEFLKEHPKVKPKLSILSKADTHKSLQNQEHELVISGRVIENIDAKFEPFANHTLAVVAHPNSRLHDHAKLSLKSLLKQNLILPTTETSVRKAIDEVFADAGLTLEPYMELSSYESIKQSIMAGLGVGILSTDAFRLEEHTGHLIRLNVSDFPIEKHWYYAVHNNTQLSTVALAFIEFLNRASIETHIKQIYSPNL
ncbi:LysR family transcriptional regulator [Thiomicrorhabdus sediminis]|uniref:LysR family transcriptional regulator n=1 Tax=Thiomicrorhabdus sediminis TaxID=2580412 RepID=A0A4P9K6H4_9GAMM|nr:LysR family transcriptional regulator [Thiomicrorhabdus sediminis]QCU89916.1 LysR family transcriptional regulator [Thiomicrorhabdus sediminis]